MVMTDLLVALYSRQRELVAASDSLPCFLSAMRGVSSTQGMYDVHSTLPSEVKPRA